MWAMLNIARGYPTSTGKRTFLQKKWKNTIKHDWKTHELSGHGSQPTSTHQAASASLGIPHGPFGSAATAAGVARKPRVFLSEWKAWKTMEDVENHCSIECMIFHDIWYTIYLTSYTLKNISYFGMGDQNKSYRWILQIYLWTLSPSDLGKGVTGRGTWRPPSCWF